MPSAVSLCSVTLSSPPKRPTGELIRVWLFSVIVAELALMGGGRVLPLGPISLRLNGPGGRHLLVSSDGTALTVSEPADPDAEAAAVLTSATTDFLAWSTKRLPWAPLVHVDGDRDVAEKFLNAVNLI